MWLAFRHRHSYGPSGTPYVVSSRPRARTAAAPKPAQHALWYSVAEPVFRRRMDTKMATKTKGLRAHILRLGLVSILVSIFRPNGVDLVDFRDFRDFRSLV